MVASSVHFLEANEKQILLHPASPCSYRGNTESVNSLTLGFQAFPLNVKRERRYR